VHPTESVPEWGLIWSLYKGGGLCMSFSVKPHCCT
jgi:hypothetical protein